MLHIILLILKIIGIILLCIIALLILLLCIIFFVPIRYRIDSDNEDKIQASASVTWLLHLVHFRCLYHDDFSYYVTVFGMKIYPKKSKKSKSKAEINKTNKKNEGSKIHIDHIKKEASEKKEPGKKAIKTERNKKETNEKKEKKNIKFTFRNLYDKIKKNISLIKKNIHRINDERTKRAFLLCKKEIFHILKRIIPRKINGIVELGMKDPSQTGELYGLYSAFFPIHKGKIVMIPFFEEEKFFYTIKAIGRIRIITILIIAIRVYFNKDIQRLIHIYRKEEEQ